MSQRRWVPFSLGAWVVSWPAVVFASAGAHGEQAIHGASHGVESMLTAAFWATAFGFVAASSLVVWLLRDQVAKALAERRQRVIEDLEEAKAAYEAAKAAYEAYSERLERLDEELARLREEMVRVGEAERDRVVSEAERRAARIRAEAEQSVERRVLQLQQQLRREAAELALAATEEALRKGLDAGEQERLSRDYLTALGAAVGRRSEAAAGASSRFVEGRP